MSYTTQGDIMMAIRDAWEPASTVFKRLHINRRTSTGDSALRALVAKGRVIRRPAARGTQPFCRWEYRRTP